MVTSNVLIAGDWDINVFEYQRKVVGLSCNADGYWLSMEGEWRVKLTSVWCWCAHATLFGEVVEHYYKIQDLRCCFQKVMCGIIQISLCASLQISPKSDVWSLGCILYYMTYGKTPFQHLTNQISKLQAITDLNHEIKFPAIAENDLLDVLKVCNFLSITKHRTPEDVGEKRWGV